MKKTKKMYKLTCSALQMNDDFETETYFFESTSELFSHFKKTMKDLYDDQNEINKMISHFKKYKEYDDIWRIFLSMGKN